MGAGSGSPVLGRPSAAAAASVPLRETGLASESAYRADGGETGWAGLRAVSLTGVRHRLAGETGDDSFAWARTDERLAMAIADGLGSLAGSGEAAARAVSAAVGAATANTGTLLDAAASAIGAANLAAAAGDGATTLVVAVAGRDGAVELARVGDSAAFAVRGDGATWSELFPPPDEDAPAGAATAALPCDLPVAETARIVLEGEDVLVLATDGVADPWRDGPSTVAPAVAAAVSARPSPLELARVADFSRQGCHDDRTLMVAWMEDGRRR
ncbi:MAG: protein phosphatase 2C domain-containing protein [Acidimicrobiales bacterium]